MMNFNKLKFIMIESTGRQTILIFGDGKHSLDDGA